MANKPLQSIKFPGLSDTYTTPQVDATLTTTGAAADAKKTGDEITSIKEDYNEVKSAISNLEDDLSTKRIILNMDSQYYTIGENTESINVSAPSSSSLYRCAVVECLPGDTFTIHGNGSTTIRPYAFIDSFGNILSKADSVMVDALVTAPTNAVKLVLNNRKANDYVSYYGTPLKTDISEMQTNVSNLQSGVSELENGYNNAQKIEIEKIAGVGSRYYALIQDKTRKYTVQGANTVWVSLQGYDSSTFDSTKEYDSGAKTPPYIFDVSALDQSLYYRVVWGKNGDFTTEEIASFSTYYYKNVTEVLNDINTSVYDHLTLVKHGSATNRYYAYITDNSRDYIVTADDAVWFALQGYSSPDYSGSTAYDSGKKYGTNKFLIENKNLFYRVCWGITGSFTDDQIATFDCYSVTTVSEAVEEANKKIRNIDLNQSIIPNSGSIMSIMHGGTTAYPSNTLKLYQIACQNGIMFWECDIRPCLDGYVLCHDDDIYNHAVTQTGEVIAQNTVKISESTIAQLQQYKFGIITNKQAEGIVPGFENQTIPTLQEFLMLAKALGAVPVLEIKFSASQTQMTEICNIVKQFGMLDCAYVLGYQSANSVLTRALDNGIRNVSIIIDDGDASASAIDSAYAIISPYLTQIKTALFNPVFNNANLNESSVQYAGSKGMKYGVWTIGANPTRQVIYDLFKIGVTAFTTNRDNINQIIADFYN